MYTIEYLYAQAVKRAKDRNALIDLNNREFGARFIVLPNPLYGDWEDALADGYFGLTPQGKNGARKAALWS